MKENAGKLQTSVKPSSAKDRAFMAVAERAAYEISCMLIPPECSCHAPLAEFAALFGYEMAER